MNDDTIKQLAAIGFITSFLALFVYFAIFPVKVTPQIERTVIGVDPIAFEIAKGWNNLNQGQTTIQIDSCNTATRIDESTWQITMKNC